MFKLSDVGLYIESDTVPWQNYRAIEFAIESGFDLGSDSEEYELVVALLRANVLDERSEQWLSDLEYEAINWLNDNLVPDGLCFVWTPDGLALQANFDDDYYVMSGKWFVEDINEMYGCSMRQFKAAMQERGYKCVFDTNNKELFTVEPM